MGPLTGVRVVELAGLGPAPFAAMLLADLGADVVRVDRGGPKPAAGVSGPGPTAPELEVLNRGRRSIAVNLKSAGGLDVVRRLLADADVVLEGFRPGVMERLGLGPDECLAANPRLIYGRMTGWGQDGPLAHSAGHDINYLALSGMLHAMGRPSEPPAPPLNVVADFGGGGMFLTLGVVSALLERATSGRGQVVDAAMVDGTAALSALFFGLRARGIMIDERGANPLDGGAPYYDVYECADGRFLAVGALEEQFYAELARVTGWATPTDTWSQRDRAEWPARSAELAAILRTRTRDEWVAAFEGVDACVSPVLDWDEAVAHPHHVARGVYADVDGLTQPAPAPRFSRTPGALGLPPPRPGEHTDAVLAELGLDAAGVAALRESGAVGG
jgi:alpha-methylacyl-CoA racemase